MEIQNKETDSVIDQGRNELLKARKTATPERRRTSDVLSEIHFDFKRLNESDFKRMLLYYDTISGSPIEYLLTGMLSALSGVIGKKAYFRLRENFFVFLNVWGIIIGPSTITKKTTAVNDTLKDIQDINYNLFQDYKSKLDIYNIDVLNNKTAPKPKREYILFPDDTTIESLGVVMTDQERGILKASEFGGFLKRLNRGYSGDSKEFLTDIYDVPKSYEWSRIGRGDVLIERPFVSLIGASTIEWLRVNIEKADINSGFLARFIYAIRNTNDKDYIPFLEMYDPIDLSGKNFNTRQVFDRLKDSSERHLTFTKEAKEKHIKYDKISYNELFQVKTNEEISYKARLLTYSLKFAGIIALVNGRSRIEVQDIEDSVLITEFYKKNAEKLLHEQLIYNEFQQRENKIYDMIIRNGGEMKHSVLYNNSNMKLYEFDDIIKSLIEKEKIKSENRKTSDKAKKLAKFYMINE